MLLNCNSPLQCVFNTGWTIKRFLFFFLLLLAAALTLFTRPIKINCPCREAYSTGSFTDTGNFMVCLHQEMPIYWRSFHILWHLHCNWSFRCASKFADGFLHEVFESCHIRCADLHTEFACTLPEPLTWRQMFHCSSNKQNSCVFVIGGAPPQFIISTVLPFLEYMLFVAYQSKWACARDTLACNRQTTSAAHSNSKNVAK